MTTPSPALLEMLARLAGGQATIDEVAAAITRDGSAPPCPAPDRAEGPVLGGSVAEGSGGVPSAGESLFGSELAAVEGATVDLDRYRRCGFGEVVFGEGKSADLITRIVRVQIAAGQNALVTRIDSTTASQVRRSLDHTHHNPLARTLRVDCAADSGFDAAAWAGEPEDGWPPHVAVVTAGSTDANVAQEAIETLRWMGVPHTLIQDVGVAGPARLIAALPRLRRAAAVVVIAGMEGALPSVVGGHLAVPVFAVPTSVGYGANLLGMTALLGMLTSCAVNVAVVNIDAGFKGGYLAGMVATRLRQAAH